MGPPSCFAGWQTGAVRRRTWVLIVLAVVILGAAGVAWLLTRDTATPVEAAVIESAFEGEVGIEPGDPGVYRYTTTGFEEIDAFAGARHDYPTETFMTITEGECGPVVRWDALEERWIDWEHCGSDLAITRSQSYHEWFGVPDLEIESCDTARPVFGATAATASTTCRAGDRVETYDSEVVGPEVLNVDGIPLETVHVRWTSRLTGASEGEATVDVWRLIGTPLIVRMEAARTSSTPSQIGAVGYQEEFRLLLISPRPQG